MGQEKGGGARDGCSSAAPPFYTVLRPLLYKSRSSRRPGRSRDRSVGGKGGPARVVSCDGTETERDESVTTGGGGIVEAVSGMLIPVQNVQAQKDRRCSDNAVGCRGGSG